MASLAQINVLFKADLDQFSSEMQKAQRELQKAGKSMQSIGAEMSTYLTAPLAALAGFSSKLNMDFDDSMRKVQATTNATAEEFNKLTDTAEQMGASTRFTASESAEAMNYMALAGWKTQQIISGIPGVLDLAAASGEGLGMVADILTDGLTAMNKGAQDAGHFVDVLAAAASNSNTTVGMLGQAFQYAAPLAGSFGYEVEDLSLAIGLMANAGIKGEKAGTALRSLMTRMVKPTREAKQALTDLGIEVKNADGSMKPLREVLDKIRDKFSNLTDAQKGQYAGMLAGQEAISGLLAIVNAAPEDFDKLSKSITNSAGTAKRMSDQMEGGVGGSWREMKSALEGVSIQIGKVLEPAFKSMTSLIRDASKWFLGLSDATKTTIVAIGGITAAIGPLLFGLGGIVKLLPVFAAGLNIVTVAFTKLWSVMTANPVVAITAAVAALGVALYAYTREADSAVRVQETLSDVQSQAQKSIARERAELDSLLKIARNENISKAKREEAIKKLNAISPSYLKNITLEKINTREAADEIKDYIKALNKKAVEQAALAKKTELFQKKIDAELGSLGERGFSQDVFDKLWAAIGYGDQVVIKNREELDKYISKLNLTEKQATELKAGYEPYLKQKERDIDLINKQVSALDDLIASEEESGNKKKKKVVVEDYFSGGGDSDAKVGSADYYNAQIAALEKLRDSTALTREDYLAFGDEIEAVREKLDSLFTKREKQSAISLVEPIPEGTISSFESLISKKREDLKLTEIGSLKYRALQNEIIDLEFSLRAKVDEASFDSASDSINRLQQELTLQSQLASDALAQKQEEALMYSDVVGNAFNEFGQNFVGSMGEAQSGLERFGQSMAGVVIKLMSMALSNAMANAIVGATQSGNSTGPAAVFTTPAFIATAIAGIIGAFASIPKFADGGIVSGPIFGLMGEYAGAANNPEVIAPLNKLKELIEPVGGGGPVHVTVGGGFELDGTKLRLVLDRTAKRGNRIG